jgi:excisionase family DNA binding protein
MGAPSPTPTLSIEDIKNMSSMAITRTQVSQALGIDPRTVRIGIEDGTIPSVRIGRRILIPRLPFLAIFGADA